MVADQRERPYPGPGRDRHRGAAARPVSRRDVTEKPELLARRGGAFYSEAAAQLIASLHDGAGDIQVVDTRNDGALPDLAATAVVEIPARIDRDGAHPLPLAPLGPEIRGLVQQVKAYEELAIDAALSGDRGFGVARLDGEPAGRRLGRRGTPARGPARGEPGLPAAVLPVADPQPAGMGSTHCRAPGRRFERFRPVGDLLEDQSVSKEIDARDVPGRSVRVESLAPDEPGISAADDPLVGEARRDDPADPRCRRPGPARYPGGLPDSWPRSPVRWHGRGSTRPTAGTRRPSPGGAGRPWPVRRWRRRRAGRPRRSPRSIGASSRDGTPRALPRAT